MNTYFDSSVLVAVYVTEEYSGAARRALRAVPQAPFTAFHELEVGNAFQLLVGRGAITRAQGRAIAAHLDQDLDAQRLVRTPLDFERVFERAGDLSRAHSATVLTRSLDLLHVAAALAIPCARFVSADSRQLAVARAAGLRAVELRRTRRSNEG